ncbi:hypothetical protein PspLS_01811 [Pyricularia sp. CBS 133598]|nr:hypothetical protein PspLS_01811 [Pyricularia sp. CBS 133598]
MFTFFRADLSYPRKSKTQMPWAKGNFGTIPDHPSRGPPPSPMHGVSPVCRPKKANANRRKPLKRVRVELEMHLVGVRVMRGVGS